MWICRYLGSFEAPLLYQGMLEIVAMTTRIIHFRCKFIFWRATLILVEKCMLLEKLVLYLVSGIHNAIISFQELKRREDAIARGLSIFWYVLERDYDTEVQSVISLFFFGSWSCYRGEKLASIFPHHPSWHCKRNTNPSTEDPVCCVHNISGYANFYLFSFVIVGIGVSMARWYLIVDFLFLALFLVLTLVVLS